MKPFSNNIIFIDTEFSSLDPYKGEILSIGLVKLNSQELYLELDHDGKVDKWVKKNILPTLKEPKVSRVKAKQEIRKFIGKKKPYLVAYVNQFDAIYWHKLFGTDNHPVHWIWVDFASILFGLDIDPESYYYGDKNNFFKKIGIDHRRYKKHNALDDARLLREAYLKFINNKDK